MNILVIGECCSDVFEYGTCERLNPEAPTPVFIPYETKTTDGMAGNVVNNLMSLLPPSSNFVGLVCNTESIQKKRYVESKSNYILLRVDTEPYIKPLDIKLMDLWLYNAIIISDYNKGFLTVEMIQFILDNHDCVFIDTKKPITSLFKKAKIIKINDLEAKNPLNDIYGLDNIIVTKGKDGCVYQGKHYPTQQVEVRDVSGAGDTFLAALTAAYVKTNDIDKSIMFANKCATHVVKSRGVTKIEDMREEFELL